MKDTATKLNSSYDHFSKSYDYASTSLNFMGSAIGNMKDCASSFQPLGKQLYDGACYFGAFMGAVALLGVAAAAAQVIVPTASMSMVSSVSYSAFSNSAAILAGTEILNLYSDTENLQECSKSFASGAGNFSSGVHNAALASHEAVEGVAEILDVLADVSGDVASGCADVYNSAAGYASYALECSGLSEQFDVFANASEIALSA